MKIIEQWLLFKYVDGQFHAIVEAVYDESSGGEGAFEATGAGTAVGWGGRNSNQISRSSAARKCSREPSPFD
jgi:hypothetical protein